MENLNAENPFFLKNLYKVLRDCMRFYEIVWGLKYWKNDTFYTQILQKINIYGLAQDYFFKKLLILYRFYSSVLYMLLKLIKSWKHPKKNLGVRFYQNLNTPNNFLLNL